MLLPGLARENNIKFTLMSWNKQTQLFNMHNTNFLLLYLSQKLNICEYVLVD